MTTDRVTIAFLLAWAAAMGVRGYWVKRSQSRVSLLQGPKDEVVLSFFYPVAVAVMPLVYAFTPWLRFAGYVLPVRARLAGVIIYAFGVWLLWCSHAHLGRHWSATVAVGQEQRLVTSGVYALVRHPMYAAHFLLGIGQALAIANWLLGPPNLVLFTAICLLRVGREESAMVSYFGDEYRAYMKRTGRLLPRLHKKG